MNLHSKFYNSILVHKERLVPLISLLATVGTFTVLMGGVWDSSSHELRVPDTFWTIQHVTIYTGASIVAISGILGGMILIRYRGSRINKGLKIIILGAVAQLVGGYADYNFHEVFGIDGLVTPSHLTVETGLLLSAIGGLILISRIHDTRIKRLYPISIMTVLLSGSWLGFNMILLLGYVVLCIPVYQIFSSGCAVM